MEQGWSEPFSHESRCHNSARGIEWSTYFVPATENGLYNACMVSSCFDPSDSLRRELKGTGGAGRDESRGSGGENQTGVVHRD